MRRGRDVGVEHGLDHRPADLLDDPDADLAAVRRREEREGQDVCRARHRETRAQIGERRRAQGVVLDKLPVRVGAALEADADTVHHGRQGQGRGQRCGRSVEAEETHAGRLQGDEREPVHVGEAAEAFGIAAPADPTGRAFLGGRIGGGGAGHAPATHRSREVGGGERRRGHSADGGTRHAVGVDGRAG